MRLDSYSARENYMTGRHPRKTIKTLIFATLVVSFCVGACKNDPAIKPEPTNHRTFQTGFESIVDFSGFYIVPQNHMNSASHDTSREQVRTGKYAHKGWIYAVNPPSTPAQNNNHRAYPTIQLHKTAGGAFKTPALIELWVWLEVTLARGEWFSFATLARSTSDAYWDAVLVNLSDAGFVHLMHVPTQGQGQWTFQTTTVKFPLRQWVKLTIEIDFDPDHGYAKVWQNDTLVSTAQVKGGNGTLPQAHFGLYAPPSLASGVVYNDDLAIMEGREK